MNRTLTGVAVASVFCLFACSKSARTDDGKATTTAANVQGPAGGSCMERRGECVEYTDNTLGVSEAACKLLEGTYGKAACPTADLLGRCDEADGRKTYYYLGNSAAPWLSDAKRDCEENPVRSKPGKFSAQANVEDAAKQKAMPTADRIIASCNMGDTCEDIILDPLKMEKDTCEQVKGKWATTPCSQQDVAASCLHSGKVTRYTHKFMTFTKPSAVQNMCNSDSVLLWGHYYPSDAPKNAQAKADPHKPAAPAKAKK
jgi:hypothetical protein